MSEKNEIGFSSYSEGSLVLSLDRHRVALNRLGIEFSNREEHLWNIQPRVHLHIQGRFTEKPREDGLVSTRFYRNGVAGAEIKISTQTQFLPEEEFRDRLIELILVACDAIIARAKKKKIEFDGDKFLEYVNTVLAAYKSLTLPLPATSGEVDFAHRWLGIPREPNAENL